MCNLTSRLRSCMHAQGQEAFIWWRRLKLSSQLEKSNICSMRQKPWKMFLGFYRAWTFLNTAHLFLLERIKLLMQELTVCLHELTAKNCQLDSSRILQQVTFASPWVTSLLTMLWTTFADKRRLKLIPLKLWLIQMKLKNSLKVQRGFKSKDTCCKTRL